jgi:hypothetical protein
MKIIHRVSTLDVLAAATGPGPASTNKLAPQPPLAVGEPVHRSSLDEPGHHKMARN